MKKQNQVNKLHTIDENETYNSPANPKNKHLTKVLEKENNIPNDPLYFAPESPSSKQFTKKVLEEKLVKKGQEQQRG